MNDSIVRQSLRRGLDQAFRAMVRLAGIIVVAILVLLFGYLFSAVAPLFRPASLSMTATHAAMDEAEVTVYLQLLGDGSSAIRVTAQGQLQWMVMGDELRTHVGPMLDQPVLSVHALSRSGQLLAIQLADHSVQIWEFLPPREQSRHPVWRRRDSSPEAFRVVSRAWEMVRNDDGYVLAQAYADNIELQSVGATGGETVLGRLELPAGMVSANQLHLDPNGHWLYAVDHATSRVAAWLLDGRGQALATMLSDSLGPILQTELLVGGLSLIVHTEAGALHRLFPQRHPQGWVLSSVLQFEHDAAAEGLLAAESARRVMFFAADTHLSVWFAQRPGRVLRQRWDPQPNLAMSIAPNGERLLRQTPRAWYQYRIENAHPEMSMGSLWASLWYESYAQPSQVWQAGGHLPGAEPKLSLAPLLHGTLKAALYALLLAVPLAIGAAMYSAYFLAPALRQAIKPGIEIMEALPTVVLGFIAGLWLAPLLEEVFAAAVLFAILTVMTLGLVAVAGPRLLPKRWRFVVYGRELLWLIPLFAGVLGLASWWGPVLEAQFFAGNLLAWLAAAMDISYAQRNAVIVGLAMGFAIIPSIYSLAEDAIYGVPQHLSQGSLALGATPWQTLSGVVLPAAAPGIFSAVMVGMGRAVGETMIVLMASGNTPVLDWSIFSGMRSMAANVAMEMPEAGVGSTHYRMLFLAALVLLAMTFLLNTLAELVRQRMRHRYRLL